MTLAAPLDLLRQARARFTQREIAAHVGKDIKTVRRWEKGETPCPSMLEPALRDLLHSSSRTKAGSATDDAQFRFIDLFAGIGGIRMGFEAHGGDCVFTSEWNDFSTKTYRENYPAGGDHALIGDIVSFPAEEVPSHDVLLGGFPCQPFSIAGVSKKNALGRPHGFECTTQGTLFFDVARIIAAKRPAAFLLENVKNLLSHDKGRTFDVILQTLRDELGYEVHYRVVDGQHFTPQHRERIIIVGFRGKTSFSWDELRLPESGPRLGSILHRTDGSEPVLPWDHDRFFDHAGKRVQPKYTLTPNLWTYLQNYAAKHRAAGNGFGFGMAYPDSVTRTLSARYHKDGSEILVYQGEQLRPRRLTPRECARLMGFPDTFRIPVSDTQAYRQFGNSVVMPVMREVARIMLPHVQTLLAKATRHGSKQTLSLYS
ncbi:DNA (cytosine-5-)-methyltransferase [Paraburkholderia caffeinilytica]|uniref:DNA (cytosine-5-)-methyltransferase n=1 Tax=Paraburkholderia caffeinilytica TaxID=1761016 RepID=UPI0038BAB4B1